MARLHLRHEAIDGGRETLRVVRHGAMHRDKRLAEFFMQSPAAGKAQHGSSEAWTVIGILDDAEVLLHEAAREFQWIVRQRGKVPCLVGEGIVQSVC
jgi:hypothetical protein